MRCLIDTCSTDLQKAGISSHRLPRKEDKRVAWLKVLDPTGTQYKLTPNSRICSRHFVESDFYYVNGTSGRRHLNHNAVPSVDLGPAANFDVASCPYGGREPWDIPRKPTVRLRNPEKVLVQPIRYAGDLKNAHLDKINPQLAKHVLPKVYKQLQNTSKRLARYKQRCLYYRKQAFKLKSLLIEMSAQHGIPIPSGVGMREQTMPSSLPEDDSDSDDERDPLNEPKVEVKNEAVEISEDEQHNDDGGDGNDDGDDDDDDYFGVRLEDEAVEELMSAL